MPLPTAALDKHIALLGTTGSGKTSVAKVAIVEPALTAGERVCVIDPTGAWWGLRIGADGKKKGHRIFIFGGDHGDYPLRAKDAAILAEAFGTSSDSAVFDTSQMTVSERTSFFTEFAKVILRKNKGPLKVIIDEAHLFMPQAGAKSGGAVPDMLHAGNNLVSLGRSRGLRITMISQRPAKLHKDSLTQAQSLIALRLIAPQDRKAINEWIADQADVEKGKAIIASLPKLAPGEAWVWAPLQDYLERVKFKRPKTFDSSAAPDDVRDGPKLSPINLDALKGKLATVEAEKKASDPKLLHAEIAELKRKMHAPQPQAADKGTLEREYQRGFNAAMKDYIKRVDSVLRASSRFADAYNAFGSEITLLSSHKAAVMTSQAREANQKPVVASAYVIARPSTVTGGDQMPKAERLILTVLAQYPEGRSKTQIAILCGYASGGGGFNNAVSALKTKGRVSSNVSDFLIITQDGLDALGTFDPLPSGQQLLQHWMNKLGKAERSILEASARAYPQALSKEDLAAETGYAADGGGFNNALSKLRTLELVEGKAEIIASRNLF